jgi:menaquinone-9 beta-reductase
MTRVAIIGAGPAGCAAAHHLAEVGLQVTLIEARPFPREKVCGEYISPAAAPILQRIVPAWELLRAGARRITTLALEVDHRCARWESPGAGWSLGRATLDTLLRDKAMAAGAAVRQPAAVRRVRYTDACVTIELASGKHLEADLVIHADGRARHDPADATPLAPNLLAYKCHLRFPGLEEETVAIRSCPGAYVGTIAIEGNLATCALVCRRALAREFPDTDDLLLHIWPTYRRAWRKSGWSACGLPRSRYVRPGHPRSLRIGNAAAAVDPVGGEGIGLALWSGAHVAKLWEQLQPDTTDPGSLLRLQRDLALAYDARLRTRLPACQLAAWILMRPHLVRALWPLAHVPGLTFKPFYRLTGKHQPVRI